MVQVRFVSASLFFCAALVCSGEQPPQPTQGGAEVTASQPTAVFKSSTNLVQVPVVVRDSAGHAVGSLQADDFQLFDGNKPQVISRFSVEKFDTTASLQTQAQAQAKTQDAASPATPGAASPEVASGALPDRFVALLLDDTNLEAQDFIQGRNAALHFAATFRPDERVAVFTASGKTTLDFTDDRDQLRKALMSINSQGRKKFYDSVTDEKLNPCPLFPYLADQIVHSGEIQTGCRDESIVAAQASDLLAKYGDPDDLAYFRALSDLIAKMSAMPGQRAILLASPGIYVPKRYQRQLTGVLADAIRARVVISGIDPRGVLGSGVMVAGGATPAAGTKVQRMAEEQERQAFMENITAGTGGMYLHGSNDLEGAIQRADSVPEYIYLLSFSPTDIKFDGQRHQLKVTLKNPRGYTLQARTSYFADGYTEDPADQVKQQIQDAFFSNQDLMGLPVRLQTQFFKDGDNATLTVNARVDATKLPFRKEDGRNNDNLTMVVGLFDQNGNSVVAYQKTIEMRLKDETLSAWMRSGIENSTDFSVKPGRYLVRLVVQDSEGHSIAAQSTGVEIPW
jgi:VWFA-related protein